MRVIKGIGILGIGFLMTFIIFPWLDTLKPTYYNPTTLVICDNISVGDTTQYAVSGDYWGLQKFTAGSSYRVYEIRLKLWQEGAGTGTFRVRLYNADASDEPSGAAICTGSLSSSVFSAVSPGEWETFSLDVHPAVVSGHEYVIVADYTASASEWVNWRVNGGNLANFAYSEDGGDTWTHGSLP